MGDRRTYEDHDWSFLGDATQILLARVPRLTDRFIEHLASHSPQFDLYIPRDEHWRQVDEALRYGIEALAAPSPKPRRHLDYSRRLGRRRAEQGLPLELLLYAYRHAGYLVWDELLDIVGEKSPDSLPVLVHYASHMWADIDRQAATVSEAYRTTEADMRRRSDEHVQALLDALLEGRTSPALVSQAAAGLDLPEQGRYAVVVLRVERPGPREPFHRITEAGGIRFFWRMRTEYEVGMAVLGEEAGPGELAAALGRRRCPGPGGISPVVGGLAELGLARRLAETALRTCGPDDTRLVRLDQRLPAALVVSQPELARRLITDIFGPLLELDPADRAVLLETLDAWLESDGSAGRAATRLYCHRNTVFNRLRRLEQLTSRSLSRPRDLTEMTLALDALRLSEPGAS